MGWFKQLGFNKCFYLSYFFIIYFLLFGLFIFGYGELGLLNQGVHNLFEGVHNFYLRVFTILFKVYNIYIKKKKKKLSFNFKKSGCATAHPHLNVAPPLSANEPTTNFLGPSSKGFFCLEEVEY
jgi:hypothetical protein